jgi:hypothetical protein
MGRKRMGRSDKTGCASRQVRYCGTDLGPAWGPISSWLPKRGRHLEVRTSKKRERYVP